MLLVLAGEQSASEQRAHHLGATVLVESARLGDEDLVYEIRIANEIERARSEAVAHEGPVRFAQAGEEPQRIPAEAQEAPEAKARGRVAHAAAPSRNSSSICRA